MVNKIYNLKDKDELTLTGKQLKEWKKMIIDDYKKSEYPAHEIENRKTIKIPELKIEVETEYHQKDIIIKEIVIPKGWRLLTFNEFLVCYNKYKNKFKDLDKTDEFILQPIDDLKEKHPYCNVWFVSVSNGSGFDFRVRGLDCGSRAFGVRFCRDIK